MTKGNDRLVMGTPEWNERMRRHRHNGLHGQAECIRKFSERIFECDSVTEQTREIVLEIQLLVDKLRESLKTRVD